MGVKLWINRKHIYLSIYANKKLWRESTGLTVSTDKTQNKEIMRMAEVIRSKREMQLAAATSGISNPELAKQTLFEYLEKLSDEKGHEKQLYKALPYLKKYGGEIKISAVTTAWYESFQNRMERDSGLAAATADKYCNVVRQALKKAVRDGLLPRDPAAGITHIRTTEGHREFLTAEEVRIMAETPCIAKNGDEVKKAFLFGVCTGLRISDIKTLTWGNIDILNMRIQKQQKKTKEWVYIPLKKEAWNVLNDKKLHNADELIFPRLAIDKSDTNRIIKRWTEAAGIHKHITWHTARHTDATMLIESGADLYTVQKLLGHSKIQTTAKYAQVTDKKKKEAVEALPDYGIRMEK